MERGSGNWRIRNDLVIAVKVLESGQDAVNKVSAAWGPANAKRVHMIWRKHVKQKYLECRRRQTRAKRRGVKIDHPFAALS